MVKLLRSHNGPVRQHTQSETKHTIARIPVEACSLDFCAEAATLRWSGQGHDG